MWIFDFFKRNHYDDIVLNERPAFICQFEEEIPSIEDIKILKKEDIEMVEKVKRFVAKEFFEEEFASLTAKKEQIEIAQEEANKKALNEVAAEFVEIRNDINAGLALYGIEIEEELEFAEEVKEVPFIVKAY